MSYAGNFLKAHGQDCTIERTVPISSKVSLKRCTKSSRDLGSREAYWEGLILSNATLISGEILTIETNKYLVQSTNIDVASGECIFFAAISNATLTHKRLVETIDGSNNVIQQWQDINTNIYGYGEIVTYQLRQYDPGLLPQTRYIFQVPKSINVVELDRITYNDNNYKVESIDSIGLVGVVRIQLSTDIRLD